MPNKQAAIKYLRKTKKRTSRNLRVENRLKKIIKDTRKLISAGKSEEAKMSLQKAIKALDKAASNGIIKKNTASRKKSRLTLAYNKINKKTDKTEKKAKS